MIPAVLAAQLAKPLVKWGVIVGAVVLLLGSVWLHGRSSGKAVVQQRWDAAVAQQAIETSRQIIAEAQMSNTVLKDHATAVRDAEARAEVIEREVVKYVQAPAKPCVVDPEFERLFDALSRLPEPAADPVPAADAGAGEPAEPQETGVTTTEVVQAYYRAIDELTFLWLDYAALVEWERGRYIVQQAQRDASP